MNLPVGEREEQTKRAKLTVGKASWPMAAAIVLFLGTVAGVVNRAIQLCHGHFGYPMDDTYIHMAMAKNFALHQVWGVTEYAFSSSTSSPLYTLILSTSYLLMGVNTSTPLLLNLLVGVLLITFASYVLRERRLSPTPTFFVLAGLVFLTPLPALAEGGMEHVLHTLLSLVFIHFACSALSKFDNSDRLSFWLIVLSPALVMTRYEGLFLILVVSVLYAIRRRWVIAVALPVAAGIPLAIYGAISVKRGWLPLPNSILLKANVPHGSTRIPAIQLLLNWAVAGVRAPHVALLALLAATLLYLLIKRDRTVWTYPSLGLVQFVSICLLHLELARTGWFYRYEAYLVAAAIVTCFIAAHELGFSPHNWTRRLAYAFGLLAFITLSLKGRPQHRLRSARVSQYLRAAVPDSSFCE